MSRLVTVYKSPRVSDLYVYMDRTAEPTELPSELRSRLGELVVALELKLDPTTRLAVADPVSVLRQIDEVGYYVQLPPVSP